MSLSCRGYERYKTFPTSNLSPHKYRISDELIDCAPKISTDYLFHDEIGKISSLSFMHQSFYERFCSTVSPKNGITSKISNFIKEYIPTANPKISDFESKSINYGYPMPQFMIDTYFQKVISDNWSINDFMRKCELFSQIPHNGKIWQSIRSYFSEYMQGISEPINYERMGDKFIKHNMQRILYYASEVYYSLFCMATSRQIDVVFIPQSAPEINEEYLVSKGIKPIELNDNIHAMLRNCDGLDKTADFSRCILLIIGGNNTDIGEEKVYLFEPKDDNKLPSDTLNYSELPWIWNTKNCPEWLQSAIRRYNGLTLSYHIHSRDVLRVYLYYESNVDIEAEDGSLDAMNDEYTSYRTRVFRHNMVDVLKAFCCDIADDDIEDIQWREFKDIQYIEFVNKYFSDLHLKLVVEDDCNDDIYNKRTLSDEWDENNMQSDDIYDTEHESTILLAMNKTIGKYYKNMGCHFNDKFIRYIINNEFDEYSLEDMLGTDANVDDCTITGFDDEFPIKKTLFSIRNNDDRHRFIFYFLQHCYLCGTCPTPEYMMDKYVSETSDDERRETEHRTEHTASSVDNVYQKKSAPEALPGKYCYQPQEGDAKMIVYGEDEDDGSNNKSQNTSNNKNNRDNKKGNNNNNNKQNDNNNDDNNDNNNDDNNNGSNGDENNDQNNGKKGGKKDEDEDKEKKDETEEKEEEEMEEDMDPKRVYRIPYKLTKPKDKSSMIAEPIDDIYNYMIDSLRILSINKGIYELPNGERIINFNFHDKDRSTEIIYGVARKANGDRKYKWKFDGMLYRADQLQQLNLYGFEKRKLPKSPISQIANHKYEVTMKLMESINNIIYKTKWCKKMVYNNINNKKQSNKKRITLSLTREAFTQHIKKYNNIKQMNGVDLIPIMVGNNSKCWLEYVWIVAIEQDVDIGISLKYESKGHIQVTGIYLDKQMLLRHHRLVLPYHKCHCLEDRFKSNKITCLEIGNVVAKENKLKDLSKRYQGLKQKNVDLEEKNVDLEEENVDLKKENEILRKTLEKWKKAMTLKQSASDLCLDVNADELLMANPEDIELQESKIEENDNVSTDIIIPTDDALSFPTKKLTESDDEDDEDNDIVDDDNDDKDAINPSTETTTPTPQNVDPPQPQQPIPMLNLVTIPTISQQSIPFQPSISIPPLTPQYSLSALSIPMPCNSLLTATSSISSLPSPMTPQFSYPLPTVNGVLDPVNGSIYNYNLLQQMNPLQITPMGAVSPYFQFPGQNVMNISTPNGSLQPLLNQQQQISRNTPYI